MLLEQDFRHMAHYNRWMNERLYAAAAALEPAQLRDDRGAFFGSLLATLHHVLVADTIWMQRFAAHPRGFSALAPIMDWPTPTSVAGHNVDDFEVLRADRHTMDAVIEALTAEAVDADYAQPLAYRNTRGQAFCKPFGLVLRHVFNHQTHHRGQVTTLFSQVGVDVGVTDLLVLLPEHV